MTGWVRSSACAGNGECIEIRAIKPHNDDNWREIRRVLDGHVIWSELVTGAEWDTFTAGIKAGDFDQLTGDTP